MRIFHHSHSKSQLKSFTLIELLMMIFFCKGECRGSRRTGAQFDCALPYRELPLLHSSDVQLILFRYSLFDVLISQVENKEEIEKKWNDSYDMNKVKRWTTELERLFSQKQSQQQDLK